jgi:hypothetical protein
VRGVNTPEAEDPERAEALRRLAEELRTVRNPKERYLERHRRQLEELREERDRKRGTSEDGGA